MFKSQHYQIIKGLINKETSDICYRYLLNKRRIFTFLHENKLISPFNDHWGVQQDAQVPGAWAHYDDVLMSTLLVQTKKKIEENINIKLIETYTYTRLYTYGNELQRHKDRPSCDISGTMNLGGDSWPIFVDPTGKENNPGIRIDLEPGDCLMYRGCEIEHWREKFYGESCGQVFLHYNDANQTKSKGIEFDGRPMLGLPNSVRPYINNKEKNENSR